MKKLRERPNLAGRRIRKYRASNQLCGPANKKTVTIDTCSGSQLAIAAETIALPIKIAANTIADTRGRGRALERGHAASEMFSARSILGCRSAGILACGSRASLLASFDPPAYAGGTDLFLSL